MFTIRNLGGIALLLAGSTWLWLMPAVFSAPDNPASGLKSGLGFTSRM